MYKGTFSFGNCRYKVSDLAAAKEYYSKGFDTKPYFDEPTWVVFEIVDYQLWLEPNDLSGESVYESTDPFYKPRKRGYLNFWMVDDVQLTCERFKQLGATILEVPVRSRLFTYAIIKDHWENELGLHCKMH